MFRVARPLGAAWTRNFHSSWHQRAINSFLLADIGEGITECEVIQWFIKPGQKIEEFDKICEVQSDKASVEITSRYAGTVTKLYYKPNEVALVGKPLVDIDSDNNAVIPPSAASIEQHAAPNTTAPAMEQPLSESLTRPLVFPSVRRLAALNGVDVNSVHGSGKRGSVLKHDIVKFINARQAEPLEVDESPRAVDHAKVSMPANTNVASASGTLLQGQSAMFLTMTESLNVPQLGYKDDVELDATMEYREQLNKHLAKNMSTRDLERITYLPIIIKSLSVALGHFPILNAFVQGNVQDVHSLQLVYRSGHHVGVAIDTPHGLAVPNIKHVERKSVLEVAKELHRLTTLAKENALDIEDLRGGTISVSNVGSISGTYSNPVLFSTSQLATLALGRIKSQPRFDANGKVVSKRILPVSWAADHRIIDGGTIARFGNTWKTLIENPALLVSELK
ncbi:2-oxoacid dehydrogenases acyltransferase-domain-containing protein [Gongronella butleri]|nr:2-oxoacid dehydrogenases acyltransferase-domain-containing protein [Gongronella butleri]